MLWVNGEISETQAYYDSGFQFGRGAFETLLVREEPLFLAEHCARLNQALMQLGISRIVKPEAVVAVLALRSGRQLRAQGHCHGKKTGVIDKAVCLRAGGLQTGLSPADQQDGTKSPQSYGLPEDAQLSGKCAGKGGGDSCRFR